MNTVHTSPAYIGTLFGVELEIEAEGLYSNEELFDDEGDPLTVDEPVIPRGWHRETEESIRGVELISAKPYTYETTVQNILTLFEDIEEKGFTPVRTCRGSTHVHVNAADLTWDQLRSFIMACAWAEPFLIEQAGPGRKGNLFAQSYEHTPLGWRPVIDWYRRKAVTHSLDTHYMATSFSPLGYLGSIEFRMGPSARNAQEAIDWLTKIKYVAEWGRNQFCDNTHDSVMPMLAPLFVGLHEKKISRLLNKAQRFANEIWDDLNEPWFNPIRKRRKSAQTLLTEEAFVEAIQQQVESVWVSLANPSSNPCLEICEPTYSVETLEIADL